MKVQVLLSAPFTLLTQLVECHPYKLEVGGSSPSGSTKNLLGKETTMKTIESLQARVALLKSRSRDNGRIIKKIERQIRAIQKAAN